MYARGHGAVFPGLPDQRSRLLGSGAPYRRSHHQRRQLRDLPQSHAHRAAALRPVAPFSRRSCRLVHADAVLLPELAAFVYVHWLASLQSAEEKGLTAPHRRVRGRQDADRFPGIKASALVAGPDRAGMPGSGQCRGSLCPGEISEEVEDERVGLVRCFQRDQMRGARDFDVAGVR